MLKKLPALLVLVLLMGCSQPKTKTTGDLTVMTFADYLKSLDTVPLPFDHSCTGMGVFPEMSVHFDSAGFAKYKDRDCAKPLGVLFNDSTNIVTVDVSLGDECQVPILTSFDKTGHKLDSLNLYDTAFDDTASADMPYFKVNRDKSIMMVDTEKRWKNGPYPNKKPDSVAITIYSTTYQLSSKGKFVKGTRKKL